MLENGVPIDQVLAELAERHRMDDPYADRPGMVNMYNTGLATVEKVATDAFGMYIHVNPLYSSTFPSVYALEKELVRAANDMLHAPNDATGSWTMGGSESIMMATKAARDGAKHITRPNMVLPISAHAAWWKAAHYLGVEARTTTVDPETYKADVAAIKAAVDENTIFVVLSAPQYGQGVIDPIEEIGEFCLEQGIRLNVDACIGGWVLPFAERQGCEIPLWDFRVPGVSSITVDLQKYGYTNKGCSLVLYRTRELRLPQFFAHANWTGYPIVNSTVMSSKPGGLLAAAWSIVKHIGDDGYMHLVEEGLRIRRELEAGVAAIPGLRIMGKPESTLAAITTDPDADEGVDFFLWIDELAKRNWTMQPQLTQPGVPPSIHFTIAKQHGSYMAEFIEVMREALDAARLRDPLIPAERLAEIHALPTDTTFADIVPIVMESFEDGKPSTKTHLVLDALPMPLREMAMLAYFDALT